MNGEYLIRKRKKKNISIEIYSISLGIWLAYVGVDQFTVKTQLYDLSYDRSDLFTVLNFLLL